MASTEPSERQILTGWGRAMPSAATVHRPVHVDAIAPCLDEPATRGVVARGLGRSYGDAAQNAGGVVVDTTATGATSGIRVVDGTVTVPGGTSLDALMAEVVPQGYFVPVSPGTRYVTVGGAIAADVHGKNHHIDGSFANHVRSLRLAVPGGKVLDIGPSEDQQPELFWATTGGMGLTGIIVEATVSLLRIESSMVLVDTDRVRDLDAVMTLMDEGDARYHYSVAWIDLMATGKSMGRSVLTRGDFAPRGALQPGRRGDALLPPSRRVVPAPPAPPGLLNKASIRIFNELYFRQAPARRRGELQSIPQFFHPLDFVDGWNRLYGPHGFLQWQSVIPFGQERTLQRVVEALSNAHLPSFLAVLKRFGAADPGPLSFPLPGWTLALDLPVAHGPALAVLLDDLDREVADAGGRIYLAKDSRLRPEMVPVMYPRLDEWREVRRSVDPQGALCSDLARRLHLL
ncbi:MAG TPA: FAD-binding oxidoreductase [Acidimicrobiales bacterium]